jgi:hypothetical protein
LKKLAKGVAVIPVPGEKSSAEIDADRSNNLVRGETRLGDFLPRHKNGQGDCTVKKASRATIFQFRAKLGRGLWRDVEIEGSDTLEDLASAILDAYKFSCDHCYGFYSKLKGRRSDSDEIYELFEDLEEGSGSENAKGVKYIRIDNVFSSKKQMRFFFDYGAYWEFILTCNGIVEPETGVQYPRTIGGKGDAPEQYPAYEE